MNKTVALLTTISIIVLLLCGCNGVSKNDREMLTNALEELSSQESLHIMMVQSEGSMYAVTIEGWIDGDNWGYIATSAGAISQDGVLNYNGEQFRKNEAGEWVSTSGMDFFPLPWESSILPKKGRSSVTESDGGRIYTFDTITGTIRIYLNENGQLCKYEIIAEIMVVTSNSTQESRESITTYSIFYEDADIIADRIKEFYDETQNDG